MEKTVQTTLLLAVQPKISLVCNLFEKK